MIESTLVPLKIRKFHDCVDLSSCRRKANFFPFSFIFGGEGRGSKLLKVLPESVKDPTHSLDFVFGLIVLTKNVTDSFGLAIRRVELHKASEFQRSF